MIASIILSLWLVVAPYNCPTGSECTADWQCGDCSCQPNGRCG